MGFTLTPALAYQLLRPDASDSDTLILGGLHAAVLLGLVAGIAALGDRWRTAEGRTAYLQLGAEALAVAGLIAIGGGALTAVTIGHPSLMSPRK